MHRIILAILLFTASVPTTLWADSPNPKLAKNFQERIKAFHEGQEPNGEKLRVIYFHPKDNPPQKDYEAQAERMVRDVQKFLHAEMQRIGFDDAPPMPIETEDTGRLKLHLVTGAGNSDTYSYESGQRVKMEIIKALGDEIDFKTDFLLVLGGLCRKRGENDYFFHAPYYGDGGSNQEWGLCYAADCEILDPLNLTEAKVKELMQFGEHNGEFPMSVARFNSWYIGGIAHEMGHGLSLPHSGQLPSELKARGNALMGGGNHTYGDERWGGGKGSFLTFASALRLAAHPLFTGSDRERFTKKESSFDQLRCEADGERLILRGKVESSPPPLAVIAYSDPPDKAGYNALTWVSEVAEDGSFTINAGEHVPGLHELRLSVLHLNGAVGTIASSYQVDNNRHPDSATLNARFAIRPAVQASLKGNPKGAA